jgi:prepilin-type N-terminal cleavage/methylation domain-containing protein
VRFSFSDRLLNNSEEAVTEFMDAQSKKKSCVSSGFTLIELLVVIAIIAR